MLTTRLKYLSQSERIRKVGVWVVSILLLFFGFYTNLWRVAEQQWFKNHQRGTESLIIGRMVKSRQDGIFSAGGLTGSGTQKKAQGDWINSDWIVEQHAAYHNTGSFPNYWIYMSQPGGQGIIFSLLDKHIPLSPKIKLGFFYVLTALLSAIALTYIIDWFYEEFGLLASICVLGSAVLSYWLTGFGKNLWWCLWAFYLPMIAVLYFLKLKRHSLVENRQFIRFGILIFIAVSIKCFINGYEYITTALVMMMTPCIYYAIFDKWSRQHCLKCSLAAITGSGVAIFLSLVMLCFQIGAVKDGFMDGVAHVIYSFGRRTYGEAEDFPQKYAASLRAGTMDVLITYMYGVFLDLNNYLSIKNAFVSNTLLKIRYYYLIVLFLLMSALLFLRSNAERRQQNIALIWTTWFSMLAPLSWFVIFKAHSHVHTHMSFLLWQMPFTLFGFAVLGSTIIAWGKNKQN